VTFSSSWNQI